MGEYTPHIRCFTNNGMITHATSQIWLSNTITIVLLLKQITYQCLIKFILAHSEFPQLTTVTNSRGSSHLANVTISGCLWAHPLSPPPPPHPSLMAIKCPLLKEFDNFQHSIHYKQLLRKKKKTYFLRPEMFVLSVKRGLKNITFF